MPALLNLQPGWALLLGGLVLLIAGLILLWLARAQTPSDAIQPTPTPIPPPLLLTASPVWTPEPLNAAAQPITTLDVPRCYDTPTNSLLCLGLLKNTSHHLWRNISFTLQLKSVSQRISLEQTYLLPGQSAPYRVLWPAPAPGEEEAVLSVLPPQAQTVSDEVVVIPVQQIDGLWLGQRYRVRGKLQNPTPKTLTHVQMVVTLLDSQGAVVAYRLRDLPPLLPDAAVPFLMDIVPVVDDKMLTPTVSVMGWTH